MKNMDFQTYLFINQTLNSEYIKYCVKIFTTVMPHNCIQCIAFHKDPEKETKYCWGLTDVLIRLYCIQFDQ